MPRRLVLRLNPVRYPRRRLGDASTILSPIEIQQYAQNAGFTGNDLQTAVAIALAESYPSGNPNSYNPEKAAGAPIGKGSFGLWQIYLYKHPEFAGQDLFDPQTNANAAYSLWSRRGGFGDWATYNSGKYQSFLQTPAPAQATFPPSDQPPLTIDAATGLPIADSAPTPLAAPSIPSVIIGLTIAGAGAYLLSEFWG